MRVRWVLITWFLANLAGWLWLTYTSWKVLTRADIPSMVLDAESTELGPLQLQVRAGRDYRDAALDANRDCRIAMTLLGINTIGTCAVAVCWELLRRRACGTSTV